MVPDWRANSVWFSSLLPGRFPQVYKRLVKLIRRAGAQVRLLEGTRDIWARDYCGIQVGARHFVKFRYCPDYLRGRYEDLITDDSVVDQLQGLGVWEKSPIILDGGNVVASSRAVILTDKLFKENRPRRRGELRSELERLLRTDRCIIVPTEPLDPIGHSDGLVRFLDNSRVVVNDYSQVDPRYGRRLERALGKHGLEIDRLPYRPDRRSRRRIPPATGNYVNFLRVGNLVVVPAHGLPEDDEAVQVLQRLLPGASVVSLDCREIAREGGCWNCVSWTVKV